MSSCTADECPRQALAKGLCSTHYGRMTRGALIVPRCVRCGTILRNTGSYWCCCSIEGCSRPMTIAGLCGTHRQRLRKTGSLDDPPPAACYTQICSVDGCDGTFFARGYCRIHYWRMRKHGDLGPAGRLRAIDGAGSIDANGYRRMEAGVREGTKLEHRQVMERMIGRPLWPDENVHHINGDRLDNRPENLELWSTRQPPGQRVADKVQWALELLKRYAPERLSDAS